METNKTNQMKKPGFKISYKYLNKPESKERLARAFSLWGLNENNLLKFLNQNNDKTRNRTNQKSD